MGQVHNYLINLFHLYKKSNKKLREVRKMYTTVFDMFEFQSKHVKPHKASSTMWVDHHMNALSNFIDKFWLHFEVIAATTKRTFKATLNPLSANPEKWSNTLKQIVGNLPTFCLSVFDHFMNLTFKGLKQSAEKCTSQRSALFYSSTGYT